MNIVIITSQERIMMGALKTAHFTLIFVGNGTRVPSLHKQQDCII